MFSIAFVQTIQWLHIDVLSIKTVLYFFLYIYIFIVHFGRCFNSFCVRCAAMHSANSLVVFTLFVIQLRKTFSIITLPSISMYRVLGVSYIYTHLLHLLMMHLWHLVLDVACNHFDESIHMYLVKANDWHDAQSFYTQHTICLLNGFDLWVDSYIWVHIPLFHDLIKR